MYYLYSMVSSFDQLDLNKKYTYADYLTWQFQERVELIIGEVFKMTPAPSSRHQSVVSSINSSFHQFLKGKKCKVFPAPFDVRLPASPDASDEHTETVVQPDVTVVCDLSRIDIKGCKGAPDLVVEVLSETSVKRDLQQKYDLYQQADINEYWVVYPAEKSISVFVLNKEGNYETDRPRTCGDVINSKVLKGFGLDLDDLFLDMVSEPEEPYGEGVRRL